MTEPVSLDYELLVLEQYQYIILNLKEGRYAGCTVEEEGRLLGEAKDSRHVFIVTILLLLYDSIHTDWVTWES